MIDLADPNTDVEELYKKYYHDRYKWIYGEHPAGFTDSYDVMKWIDDQSKGPLGDYNKRRDNAKQLINIWVRIGFLIPDSGSVMYKVIKQ